MHQFENPPYYTQGVSLTEPQAHSSPFFFTVMFSIQFNMSNYFQKFRMVAEVTAPDQKKVIRQLEYYFGDSNLQRDKFLQDEIKKDPEGWISLETMLKVSTNPSPTLS